MKELRKLAVADGLCRVLALKIITDFSFSSVSGASSGIIALVVFSVAGFALPLAFEYCGRKTVRQNVNRYFLISLFSFIAAFALIFINLFTLHINFFPIRELGNVDGLFPVIGLFIYFIGNAVCRLIGFIVFKVNAKKEVKQ